MIGSVNTGGSGSKPSPTDAVLRVTAQSGSTVTITKSGVTRTPNFYLDGTDTDEYFFYIKVADFGEYTVTATLEALTDSKTININLSKEFFVSILFEFAIFEVGKGITIPYYFKTAGNSSISVTTESILINKLTNASYNYVFRSQNILDLTKYKTLSVVFDVSFWTSGGTGWTGQHHIGISSNAPTSASNNPYTFIASTEVEEDGLQTITVDISDLTSGYLAIGAFVFGAITSILLIP